MPGGDTPHYHGGGGGGGGGGGIAKKSNYYQMVEWDHWFTNEKGTKACGFMVLFPTYCIVWKTIAHEVNRASSTYID